MEEIHWGVVAVDLGEGRGVNYPAVSGGRQGW